MAVISRALFKGARGAKKAKDRREREKRKEAIRQEVSQFTEVWIDLDQSFEVIHNADLTKSENSFLIVERIELGRIIETLTPGTPVQNFNPAILEQFTWFDTKIMRFTAYPITDKHVGAGMFIRFLIWTKKDFPGPCLMHVYTATNEDTMCPEIPSGQFRTEPNSILVVDVFISGALKENEQNNFLTLFSYFDNTTSREFVLKVRTRANFERDTMTFENYEEIKNSKFLNTIEQKHIHPIAVKTIIKKQILGNDFSIKAGRKNIIIWCAAVLLLSVLLPIMGVTGDLGFFFWSILVLYAFFILFFAMGVLGGISEIKLVKKSRSMMLINEKTKDTRLFDPINRTWLIDYCDISEYWSFNADIPDLTDAFSFQNKSLK